jgi:hypothetical protein
LQKKTIKPIFLISLPRSGSTLLQRVLITHPEIDSYSESWLLLPLIQSLKKSDTIANYGHSICTVALNAIISEMGGIESYYEELRRFVLNVYSQICTKGSIYYLDKTPRYYLIVDDIVRLFPDAKYIFLFRDPKSIYASIIRNWGKNRLNKLHYNYIDLYEGPRLLAAGYESLRDKSILIQYEKFVLEPVYYLEKIADYLNIDKKNFSPDNLSKANTEWPMGDMSEASFQYNRIMTTPNAWNDSFDNLIRKRILLRYVRSVDEKFLEYCDTTKYAEMKAIMDIRCKTIGLRDIVDFCVSTAYRKVLSKLHNNRDSQLLRANSRQTIYY